MRNKTSIFQCNNCNRQYLTVLGIMKHVAAKHPYEKVGAGYTTRVNERINLYPDTLHPLRYDQDNQS